jgi:hypothetical protein
MQAEKNYDRGWHVDKGDGNGKYRGRMGGARNSTTIRERWYFCGVVG